MSRLLRHIMNRILLGAISCLLTCVFVTSASAQHPIAPVPRPVPGVHMPAPVTPHPPVLSPPVNHLPIGPTPFTPTTSIPRIPGAFYGAGAPAFRPYRPIHNPNSPVILIYRPSFFFSAPLWTLNHCWWTTCDYFYPWTINYATVSSPGPIAYIPQVYETQVYVYGPERPDLPQLFLKDGTILNVTDYWLVDDQLHFTIGGENGANPAEQVIPFDALDLQTTVDANTQRGFRFMLRDEPYEQYLRDHPEGPPKALTPDHP